MTAVDSDDITSVKDVKKTLSNFITALNTNITNVSAEIITGDDDAKTETRNGQVNLLKAELNPSQTTLKGMIASIEDAINARINFSQAS